MIPDPTLSLWIALVALLGLACLRWWERRGPRVMLAAKWFWAYRGIVFGWRLWEELRERRWESAAGWIRFNYLLGCLTPDEREYAYRRLHALLNEARKDSEQGS